MGRPRPPTSKRACVVPTHVHLPLTRLAFGAWHPMNLKAIRFYDRSLFVALTKILNKKNTLSSMSFKPIEEKKFRIFQKFYYLAEFGNFGERFRVEPLLLGS
jgi:hypothetical protein